MEKQHSARKSLKWSSTVFPFFRSIRASTDVLPICKKQNIVPFVSSIFTSQCVTIFLLHFYKFQTFFALITPNAPSPKPHLTSCILFSMSKIVCLYCNKYSAKLYPEKIITNKAMTGIVLLTRSINEVSKHSITIAKQICVGETCIAL